LGQKVAISEKKEKICGEYPDQASPLVGLSIRRIAFKGIGNTLARKIERVDRHRNAESNSHK
jgi:hypothetical protein